jgi:Uma2 family endonuclease
VEIRSPRDRAGAVLAKVGDWLDAGSQVVWVVDPLRRLVSIYRADGSQALLGVDDVLDGGDLLPGFTFAVAELFAE